MFAGCCALCRATPPPALRRRTAALRTCVAHAFSFGLEAKHCAPLIFLYKWALAPQSQARAPAGAAALASPPSGHVGACLQATTPPE